MMSPADHIVQLEHVVRTQMTAIDELRAQLGQLRTENQRLLDWIMGEGPDALLALQKVYSDPRTSVPDVIKSANAALPFERAKPASVSVVIDFKERVRNARLRTLEQSKAKWAAEDAAKVIEHQPLDLDAPTPATILGGPEADPAA
jgi:hypothetical protein